MTVVFCETCQVQRRVVFIGNVRPQTGNWYFEEPVLAESDGERIQVIVQQSLFNVRIDTDGPDELVDEDWLERVWLQCLAVLRAALDTLGFHRGASLELERLTAMVDDKAVLFFRDSQPRFQTGEGERVEGEVMGPFFAEAMNNPSFRHALADVRQAQRLDDDAAFYCYRAIEGLRQSFVLPGESAKTGKGASWERLRSALNVTEQEVREIAEAARARRHGGVDSSELASRLQYVLLTRDLIIRYVTQIATRESEADQSSS